ncbi:putative permease often clustered with de novo purine synthesis [Hyalangium minutum]|uniref:Putative permease often clustered with de novo purine synthesis n=1 Tax=Hyalangium minutum TaxID=394096 RepID=A0A085WRF6_9BACT|nr:putative permease often clustered with de novo purine synthesis [Hyalangium minutum]
MEPPAPPLHAVPAPAVPELPEEAARRIDLTWSLVMVGALGLVFGLLAVFGGVAVPVLLALTGAYVFNPVVSALERRGLNRTWGTTIVFGGCTLVMVGAVLYLIPVFQEEAAKLPEFFRQASTQVVPQIEALLGVSVPEFVNQRTAELGAKASELLQSAGPAAARLAASFAGNTARFMATLLGLAVVPVLGFFFLQDYPKLIGRVRDLIPRPAVGLVRQRFSEVDDVLSAFVQGQLTVGSILSVIYSTGLSIAGLDMAIVIGVITGFGNMVPYMGTAMGLVLAMLGLMLSWQGPWQIAVVAGTFLVAQLSEGLVITPRIVGEKVGLRPVTIIIAILGFGELFGFVGILLAVPVSAILKVVLRVVVLRYQKTRLYMGEAAKP